MNTYEGLFLLNSVEAKRDWDATSGQVRAILEKHGAEISTNYLWDDRKLAYEIDRNKRATYYLVYFKAKPGAIVPIRRDCGLCDVLLRHMIMKWEGDAPPMPTDEELAKLHAELAAVAGPGRNRPMHD